ncbi:MAG TPA: response regulator [Gemmatimonadaceae bacterium]|nr:response regulator [Gemmatimonadaceae bacterium]
MATDTFLVIDDEPQIRRVLRRALGADGARVIEAATAAEGVDAAAAHQPSLVVLDLGLPDGAGVDVCREIRRWSTVPIIVLSARYADDEKIALLDAGADDYVTKPFNPEELVARVRAQLRRARVGASPAPGPLQLDGITVDLVARTVTRDGEPVHLTKTEWELLRVFLTHAGRTMTHRQLFAEVWGAGVAGDAQQYLRVYVANLRRKLEVDPVRPRLIVTEPGVGYRLDRPR